jgi:hypothetical protein
MATVTSDAGARQRMVMWTFALMPNPVRFRVPAKCPHCQASGPIVPETTIKGDSVVMTWCCRTCSQEWPVTVRDQIERRTGQPDRRRVPRKDRRKA